MRFGGWKGWSVGDECLGGRAKIREVAEAVARVLTKRSRGMRELDVSVKDSRGSGAIAKLLILVLVSSSAEDRSNPRDRARSSRCGNTASRLFSSEAEESIYLLISITIQFLAAGARARVRGLDAPGLGPLPSSGLFGEQRFACIFMGSIASLGKGGAVEFTAK